MSQCKIDLQLRHPSKQILIPGGLRGCQWPKHLRDLDLAPRVTSPETEHFRDQELPAPRKLIKAKSVQWQKPEDDTILKMVAVIRPHLVITLCTAGVRLVCSRRYWFQFSVSCKFAADYAARGTRSPVWRVAIAGQAPYCYFSPHID
ncbi:hypothetical protein J6590_043125 [Homalodisca vitripennis]|nr:hypothetical protein J6590_043125 [Homalodisca vitripennis]